MIGNNHFEWSLTGSARVRPGWFGRPVLQVEEKIQTVSNCPPMPGRTNDAQWQAFCRREPPRFEWRDATLMDCMTMKFTID